MRTYNPGLSSGFQTLRAVNSAYEAAPKIIYKNIAVIGVARDEALAFSGIAQFSDTSHTRNVDCKRAYRSSTGDYEYVKEPFFQTNTERNSGSESLMVSSLTLSTISIMLFLLRISSENIFQHTT